MSCSFEFEKFLKLTRLIIFRQIQQMPLFTKYTIPWRILMLILEFEYFPISLQAWVLGKVHTYNLHQNMASIPLLLLKVRVGPKRILS